MEKNNKLIAEFMQKGSDGFGLYDFDGCHYRLDELKFHTSWDWLMPVINKCYQEHMSKHFDANLILSIAGAVMNCDKDKAYQVALEFIKEYNEKN